jgi:hypothetical protein
LGATVGLIHTFDVTKTHPMKNSKLFTIVTFLFVIALAVSCKKEESDASNNNTNNTNPTPTSSTYLCGTVIDRDGDFVLGAEVRFGTLTETTNEFGYFAFGNVAASERCYVSVNRAGYFETGLGVFADFNGITNMKIVMTDNLPDLNFNAATGGTANLVSGASVVFPAGGIVYEDGTPYNGSVSASVEYLNPDDPNFAQIIPGGDLSGVETDGDQVALLSYGMLLVNLTDAVGNDLNLAPEALATLNFPVPNSMTTGAPATMPAWHFNEETGFWEEEGTLTLNGGMYTGTVSHFSSWNADVPFDRAEVTGLVTDCNGDPLSGALVRVGQGFATTGTNGVYHRFVPTGIAFDVYVDMPSVVLSSNVAQVPALSNGQLYEVETLQSQCPAFVSGTITCNTGSLTAFVAVSWSGGYANVPVSAGSFSIPVPSDGTTGELNAIGANTGIIETVNITFPNQGGANVNAGSFELCGNGPTGDFGISMTLNGGGFNNYNFDISTTPQFAFGSYSIPDGFMQVYSSNAIADFVTLSYPGTSPGSWDLENDPDAVAGFSINGDLWFAQSGTITVTQSGNVGQPISGTFSGTVSHFDGIDFISAQMTNGTFYVIRNPDQQ